MCQPREGITGGERSQVWAAPTDKSAGAGERKAPVRAGPGMLRRVVLVPGMSTTTEMTDKVYIE